MKTRVLVVDNDALFLASVKAGLESFGDIQVFTEQAPPNVVDTARRVKAEIVLLDLVMPGMTGDQVAEKLRDNADTKHIPIVFFTGSGKLVTRQEVSVANGVIGGEEYIIKGIDPEALRVRILKRLQRF